MPVEKLMPADSTNPATDEGFGTSPWQLSEKLHRFSACVEGGYGRSWSMPLSRILSQVLTSALGLSRQAAFL
jgi:hypothetical protein